MKSRPIFAPPVRQSGLLVGMVHVLPSPASPGFQGLDAARKAAGQDAQVLVEQGFDAILLENMHDFPPLREEHMGPEIPAYLTTLALEIRQVAPAGMPVGIQVLFAAHQVALAVALAAGLDFVRAESWTYGHLSDKGWAEAGAARALRYARAVGADQVRVWADVKKKHASHAATADLSLGDVAAGLELHGAHAAVITGSTTGEAPLPDDLTEARRRSSLPIVLGSGLTVQNAEQFAGLADAFIVGSSIKHDGNWRAPVDPQRARALVGALRPSS